MQGFYYLLSIVGMLFWVRWIVNIEKSRDPDEQFNGPLGMRKDAPLKTDARTAARRQTGKVAAPWDARYRPEQGDDDLDSEKQR